MEFDMISYTVCRYGHASLQILNSKAWLQNTPLLGQWHLHPGSLNATATASYILARNISRVQLTRHSRLVSHLNIRQETIHSENQIVGVIHAIPWTSLNASYSAT